MVLGSHGRRAVAELLLFLGRGPLQRGVLQQLMHTEFSFPGEQKDWYPAEAMRQAADDAHDLRYMIPATQTQRSEVSLPVPAKGLQPPRVQSPGTALPYSSHSPEPWWVQENTQGCFLEHPKSTTYAMKKAGLISLAFDSFSQGYLRCQYQ